MRRLIAWAISFSTKDRIVNQAVRELDEIARQKVSLHASMPHAQQCQGYQQARLRRYVRDYFATLQRGQWPMNPVRRQELTKVILERLSSRLWDIPGKAVTSENLPRKAA